MTRRAVVAVVTAGLLALTGGADPAAAAGPRSQAQAGLELLGRQSHTVRFVAGDAQLAMLVRNRSARRGRIELVFVARSGDRYSLRSRRQVAGSPIRALDSRDLRAPIGPGAIRRIELRLLLPADRAPRDGGGVLHARISGARAKPATLAIRGAPPDITFDPSRLTVDVSQACWLVVPACGETQTVLLRGRDAVRWARRTDQARSIAILNNDRGGSVTILMRDLEVREGAVHAKIDASSVSEAGRYRGRLPIEPNGVAGPSLLVDVKVRRSLAAAVLAIFAGAVLGGFFLRRFEIRRRQRLLELELLSALHRYDEARRAQAGAKPAAYNLDNLLEPRRQDRAATMPYPGTRGVSALLWHIKTARDDADFSEDIARTQRLIAAIERWLTLEPVARETAQLLEGDPPPARGSLEFADTTAYRDLAYLAMRATRPPTDDLECEWLVGALASQGRVVAKCKVIWELLAELESRAGWLPDEAEAIAEVDVVTLERAYPEYKYRSPEQTDLMLVSLRQAEDRLRRLHGDAGSLDTRPRVVEAHRIDNLLDAPANNPAIDRGMLDLSPWRLRLAGAFSGVALRAAFWTLARALVAAVAYALTIYSDTWGSVTDFASAFTAGFLTETIVNWAVLPAFRSNRNRSETLPSPPSPPPPAGEETVRHPERHVGPQPPAGNGHTNGTIHDPDRAVIEVGAVRRTP